MSGRHTPEVGVVCGKAAPTVLCGGRAMKRTSLPLQVVPRCCRLVQIGTYRVGLFAGSTLAHCGRCALTVPSTWMTPPSVITPRSTNKLKRAKQLSGTASASDKSGFMAKCVCL